MYMYIYAYIIYALAIAICPGFCSPVSVTLTIILIYNIYL